jgi:small subunit ribosomal protein S8
MNTDPIADYLTRIRNGIGARKRVVEIPHSKIKEAISRVLLDMGYIANYKVYEANGFKHIKVALKYDAATKRSVIQKLERISSPGLRVYAAVDEIPRVLNGLGISIISTSKGVMTGKQAQAENVGGEVLCIVY